MLQTSNGISGVFNSSTDADHYIIVRSTSSTLSNAPTNGISYNIGDPIGGGNIVTYQTDTLFADTNLVVGNQYWGVLNIIIL